MIDAMMKEIINNRKHNAKCLIFYFFCGKKQISSSFLWMASYFPRFLSSSHQNKLQTPSAMPRESTTFWRLYEENRGKKEAIPRKTGGNLLN